MLEFIEMFPYVYGTIAAVNTCQFAKQRPSEKQLDLTLLFYGSLLATIDLIPLTWNGTETLSQMADLKEFETVGKENIFKAGEMIYSALGQAYAGYRNIKHYISEHKVKK